MQKEELKDSYIYEDDFEKNYDIYKDITYNTEAIEQFTMLEVPANMLNIDEYSSKYGVSPEKISELINCGKIPATKDSENWRISELVTISESDGDLTYNATGYGIETI